MSMLHLNIKLWHLSTCFINTAPEGPDLRCLTSLKDSDYLKWVQRATSGNKTHTYASALALAK